VPCVIITAIEHLDVAKALPGVQEIAFTSKVGDYAGGIYSSADRIGFVIADGKDADEAENTCQKCIKHVSISIK